MSEIPDEKYIFHRLPKETAFRVVEILPGEKGSIIYCKLHVTEWDNLTPYEAVSYAWGDPNVRAPVVCDGKSLEITRSLHTAINHLRYADRSRVLWADALW